MYKWNNPSSLSFLWQAPGTAKALLRRAEAFERLGNLAAAIADYKELLRLGVQIRVAVSALRR
jgi:hypothetical protein